MVGRAAFTLLRLADTSVAGSNLKVFIRPVMYGLIGLATLVASFFLVNAGISVNARQYMNSEPNLGE